MIVKLPENAVFSYAKGGQNIKKCENLINSWQKKRQMVRDKH